MTHFARGFPARIHIFPGIAEENLSLNKDPLGIVHGNLADAAIGRGQSHICSHDAAGSLRREGLDAGVLSGVSASNAISSEMKPAANRATSTRGRSPVTRFKMKKPLEDPRPFAVAR